MKTNPQISIWIIAAIARGLAWVVASWLIKRGYAGANTHDIAASIGYGLSGAALAISMLWHSVRDRLKIADRAGTIAVLDHITANTDTDTKLCPIPS